MNSSRPYIIRAIYEWIVDNDCTPHLLVDVEMEGVEVPQAYVSDGQIVLNVSPTAVVGLDMGNDYIYFNGRFGGVATDITVPIKSILGIYAERMVRNGVRHRRGSRHHTQPSSESRQAQFKGC